MKSMYIFISLLLISTTIEAELPTAKGLVKSNERLSLFNLQLRQLFQSNSQNPVDRLEYKPECILPIPQHREGDYTFGKNIQVNDDSAGTAYHSTRGAGGANIIVARGDTLYIVWSDARECTTGSQIYFAKSINGGVSFLPNVKVDDIPPHSSIKLAPSIAVDGLGRIYIAWSDSRSGNFDVYFAKSEDGGVTFSKNICVTDTGSRTNQDVSIGVAGDNIYIVWADTRHWDGSGNPREYIYSDRSRDGGLTFGKDIKVDDFHVDGPPVSEMCPCIDVIGDTVYVVWYHLNFDPLEGNIRFDKSIDGGVTFGTDVKIPASGFMQLYPSLTVDRNSTIHIAFYNVTNAFILQVLYAKSTDGGASFSQITEVTDTTLRFSGSSIDIATDTDCNPYIVWEDGRDSVGITHPYFSYSDDGGNSFSKNVRVVDKPGTIGDVDQYGVGLAVDDNKNVYAVWSDRRNHNKWYDIYFAKGTQVGIEESSKLKAQNLKLETYPNPFNRETVIYYLYLSGKHDDYPINLACHSEVAGRDLRLAIYDLTGRLVRTFPISNSITWDGRDNCGKLLPSGVYFCKLFTESCGRVDDKSLTKQIILLR
ncbi:MAG: hypothetical protein QMD71_07325 [bacterium]|nr:hypothetical protein [bacterium]